MADVRIYNRAMTNVEIQELASPPAAEAHAPSATIIVASDASRIDKFAASELQRCLTMALGWDVNISEDKLASSNGPMFFVGSLNSDVASEPGFPTIVEDGVAALHDEGIYLKGDGRNVALVGKGSRGGLCAVYEFLERYVGFRWPEPGREYAPQLSSLGLEFELTHSPAFSYRGVALHGPCSDAFYQQIIDWLAKNRLNSLQFSCEIYEQLRPEILDSILDRGLSPKIGAHSRQFFYSSAKYFPRDPEHFALVEGTRTGDTQLCYSNHSSVTEYSDNVIAYLRSRPEIGVVGLWPSDGYGFCECDRCKAQPTTDVLLEYVNDVSARIHAQHPKVKVEFLSYIHYTTPPEKVTPLPYVVPTYCEYWSRNQFHPITDDRASNANCRRQLEQWVKRSHEATVYSYYADDTMKRFLYNPVSDVVLSDLQYYRGIGVAGNSVLMMNPQNWWSNAPHMYAYAKASWDPAATLDEISHDYFTSLYGPVAKSMQAHQQAARELFDTEFDHGETGEAMLFGFRIKKFDPAREASSLSQFSNAVMRMRDCLAAAESITTDPWVLKRVEILDQDAQLMGCIYGILNEAAGYKADQNEARKDQMRALLARVDANEVATKEDVRGKILKSLLPQVSSVLGPDEAARYDRVVVLPPE
jgi:hypothetical protein